MHTFSPSIHLSDLFLSLTKPISSANLAEKKRNRMEITINWMLLTAWSKPAKIQCESFCWPTRLWVKLLSTYLISALAFRVPKSLVWKRQVLGVWWSLPVWLSHVMGLKPVNMKNPEEKQEGKHVSSSKWKNNQGSWEYHCQEKWNLEIWFSAGLSAGPSASF